MPFSTSIKSSSASNRVIPLSGGTRVVSTVDSQLPSEVGSARWPPANRLVQCYPFPSRKPLLVRYRPQPASSLTLRQRKREECKSFFPFLPRDSYWFWARPFASLLPRDSTTFRQGSTSVALPSHLNKVSTNSLIAHMLQAELKIIAMVEDIFYPPVS